MIAQLIAIAAQPQAKPISATPSSGVEFVLLGLAGVLTLAILVFFIFILSRKEKQ